MTRLLMTTLADWKNKKIGNISRIQVQQKYSNLTERSPAQANITTEFTIFIADEFSFIRSGRNHYFASTSLLRSI